MPHYDLDYPRPKHPGSASYRRYETQLHLNVHWPMLAAFQSACYRNGLSMSEVLRGAMERYVAEHSDRGESEVF